MEKYYTINDVAMMTGLTTRTVRNYIKTSVLSGEKIDGIWRFTEEEVNDFVSNPAVRPSIQAKSKAIIYDFLLDDKKKMNATCSILDLCVSEDEAEEISQFFCEQISKYHGGADIKFSYERRGENARIILSGYEDAVTELLNAYYSWK